MTTRCNLVLTVVLLVLPIIAILIPRQLSTPVLSMHMTVSNRLVWLQPQHTQTHEPTPHRCCMYSVDYLVCARGVNRMFALFSFGSSSIAGTSRAEGGDSCEINTKHAISACTMPQGGALPGLAAVAQHGDALLYAAA